MTHPQGGVGQPAENQYVWMNGIQPKEENLVRSVICVRISICLLCILCSNICSLLVSLREYYSRSHLGILVFVTAAIVLTHIWCPIFLLTLPERLLMDSMMKKRAI